MEDKNKTNVLFSPAVEVFCGFASSVDASRLNMENKQMGQLVISKNTDTPFIIDKYYKDFTTLNSPYQEVALDDGIVLFKSDELLIIYYINFKRMELKHIPKFKKLINNSLSLKYCVSEGITFKKGDSLFDYSNYIPESQLPRVGYRTNILFSSFYGFNSDDAFVASESFAKRTEIEYSSKIFIPITKFMKFLKHPDSDSYFSLVGSKLDNEDKVASYYNIDMDDFFLTEIINIDETSESKYYTKTISGIKNGTIENIKVHKFTDASFQEKRKEYIYTKELITELEFYYKKLEEDVSKIYDKLKSLGLSKEDCKNYTSSIKKQYFEIEKPSKVLLEELSTQYNIQEEHLDYLVEIDISYTTGSTKGDKFSNLYAGKGTLSLIVPDELMPKDPNTGKPFDLIFNTLGIPGRNNWGSIFELNIGKIIVDIENSSEEERYKKLTFVAENILKKTDVEYYQSVSQLLSGGISGMKNVFKDIDKNGLYLFFGNFNNITYSDFMKEVQRYEKEFDVSLTKKEKIEFSDALTTYMRSMLHLENPIFKQDEIKGFYNSDAILGYGQNYLIKLYHTSDSKYNSTAFANNYSKTTGQPLKGRKAQGGQHLSWQSTASILSHHENNDVLKELYTFKSDSHEDKETFLMKIIKDGEYHMRQKYESSTKKTINTALKVIGLGFTQQE